MSVVGHDVAGRDAALRTKWKVMGRAWNDLGSNDVEYKYEGRSWILAVFHCGKPQGPARVNKEITPRSTFRYFGLPAGPQGGYAAAASEAERATAKRTAQQGPDAEQEDVETQAVREDERMTKIRRGVGDESVADNGSGGTAGMAVAEASTPASASTAATPMTSGTSGGNVLIKLPHQIAIKDTSKHRHGYCFPAVVEMYSGTHMRTKIAQLSCKATAKRELEERAKKYAGQWDGRSHTGKNTEDDFSKFSKQVVAKGTPFNATVILAALDGLGVAMLEIDEGKQSIIWGKSNYDPKLHPLLVRAT